MANWTLSDIKDAISTRFDGVAVSQPRGDDKGLTFNVAGQGNIVIGRKQVRECETAASLKRYIKDRPIE